MKHKNPHTNSYWKNNPLTLSILQNTYNIQEISLTLYCFFWVFALSTNTLTVLSYLTTFLFASFLVALLFERFRVYASGIIFFQMLAISLGLMYGTFLITKGSYLAALLYSILFGTRVYLWLYPEEKITLLKDFFECREVIESHLINDFPSFYVFRKYVFWTYVAASFVVLPIATIIFPEHSSELFSFFTLLGLFFCVTIILFVFVEIFILAFANPAYYKFVMSQKTTILKFKVFASVLTFPSALVGGLLTATVGVEYNIRTFADTPGHCEVWGLDTYKKWQTSYNPGGSYIIKGHDLEAFRLVKAARENGVAIPVNVDHSINKPLLIRLIDEAEALARIQKELAYTKMLAISDSAKGDPGKTITQLYEDAVRTYRLLDELSTKQTLTVEQLLEKSTAGEFCATYNKRLLDLSSEQLVLDNKEYTKVEGQEAIREGAIESFSLKDKSNTSAIDNVKTLLAIENVKTPLAIEHKK